jgi:hypothetical protein
MGTLLDCIKIHGKDLDPARREEIIEKFKKNLRGKFTPAMAGKNALLDVISELEAEHTAIFKKASKMAPKAAAKTEQPEPKTPAGQASVGKFAPTERKAAKKKTEKTEPLASVRLKNKQPGPIPSIEHKKLPKLHKRNVTMKKIEMALDIPIRVGKYRKTVGGVTAAGIYKPGAKVIRLQKAGDIPVAIHEVGHHIQSILELAGKMPKEIRAMAYPGAKSKSKEGFAEFVSHYVTDPEFAKENAPDFFKKFEDRLSLNTDLQNILVETRQKYNEFQQAPSVAKVMSFIVSGQGRKKHFPSLNKIYTELKDELYPIKQVVDIARKGGAKLAPSTDPYLVARMFRGWPRKAEQWLKIRPFQYTEKPGATIEGLNIKEIKSVSQKQAVEFVGESLVDILEPVEQAGSRHLLDAYLVAKRAVNDQRILRGFDRVLNVKDFKQTVKELESQFEPYAKRLYDYQNQLLEYLVESGRISQELSKTIRSKNLFYVPFNRLIEHSAEFGSLGKRFGNVPSPIKRLKGSSRDIISPTENIMKNTYIMINAAERNRVGSALLKLSQVKGMGKYIERVPFPLTPKKIARDDFFRLISDYGTPEIVTEVRESEKVISETLNKLSDAKTPSGKVEVVVKEALKSRGWSEGEATQIIERVKGAEGENKSELIEKTIEKTRLMVIKETLGFSDMPDSVIHTFRPEYRSGPNEAIFYDKGKPYLFELDPELAKTITGISHTDINFMVQAMAFPAKLLRAGATTFSPEFAIRNPIRDQLTSFIQSKYGYVPGIDFTRGLFHILGKTELYQQFNASGAGYSNLVSMDRQYLKKNLRQLVRGRAKGVVRNPLEALRVFSELTEESTRVGEFAKALKKEGKGLDGLLKAGFAGKEVNLDFSNQGRATAKALNLISAFWNARLEGIAKMGRSFKDHPFRTSYKAFLGVTLPTLILWAIQKDDEFYQELPPWRKVLFWNIVIHNDDGSLNTIIPIPKPFEWGILFGSIPEEALNWAYTKDPEGMKKAAEQLLKTLDVAPIPTGAIPIMEWWGNKSWFFDRPIVPRDKEILDPSLQYGPSTHETTKLVSKMMEKVPGLKSVASAAKLENLIRGYTASFGNTALEGTDWILEAVGVVDKPPEPKWKLTDYPMLRAFRVRFPSSNSASIRRFYDTYQKLLTRRESAKEREDMRGTGIEGVNTIYNVEQALDDPDGPNILMAEMTAQILSADRKEANRIYKDRNLTPEQKRKQLDDIYFGMINTARGFFGKEPINERR